MLSSFRLNQTEKYKIMLEPSNWMKINVVKQCKMYKKEVLGIRTKTITKEGIDVTNHMTEIDYNRDKMVDIEELISDIKAAIVTQKEQETRELP